MINDNIRRYRKEKGLSQEEMAVSLNIRRYRKEKGLSQEEMAVSLHVVRQTVSKWENGVSQTKEYCY